MGGGEDGRKGVFWWPDGDTNAEGREIEDLFSSLNLSQIISERTNFQLWKKTLLHRSDRHGPTKPGTLEWNQIFS